MAHHGKLLGIPITCVMPTIAPLTKINNCQDYGAQVILHGDHILEAREFARKLEKEQVRGRNHVIDGNDIYINLLFCGDRI